MAPEQHESNEVTVESEVEAEDSSESEFEGNGESEQASEDSETTDAEPDDAEESLTNEVNFEVKNEAQTDQESDQDEKSQKDQVGIDESHLSDDDDAKEIGDLQSDSSVEDDVATDESSSEEGDDDQFVEEGLLIEVKHDADGERGLGNELQGESDVEIKTGELDIDLEEYDSSSSGSDPTPVVEFDDELQRDAEMHLEEINDVIGGAEEIVVEEAMLAIDSSDEVGKIDHKTLIEEVDATKSPKFVDKNEKDQQMEIVYQATSEENKTGQRPETEVVVAALLEPADDLEAVEEENVSELETEILCQTMEEDSEPGPTEAGSDDVTELSLDHRREEKLSNEMEEFEKLEKMLELEERLELTKSLTKPVLNSKKMLEEDFQSQSSDLIQKVELESILEIDESDLQPKPDEARAETNPDRDTPRTETNPDRDTARAETNPVAVVVIEDQDGPNPAEDTTSIDLLISDLENEGFSAIEKAPDPGEDVASRDLIPDPSSDDGNKFSENKVVSNPSVSESDATILVKEPLVVKGVTMDSNVDARSEEEKMTKNAPIFETILAETFVPKFTENIGVKNMNGLPLKETSRPPEGRFQLCLEEGDDDLIQNEKDFLIVQKLSKITSKFGLLTKQQQQPTVPMVVFELGSQEM